MNLILICLIDIPGMKGVCFGRTTITSLLIAVENFSILNFIKSIKN